MLNKYLISTFLVVAGVFSNKQSILRTHGISDLYSPEMEKIRGHCDKYYDRTSDSRECSGPVCGRNLNNHSLIKFETDCAFHGWICVYVTLYEPVLLKKCEVEKDVPYISKRFEKNMVIKIEPFK